MAGVDHQHPQSGHQTCHCQVQNQGTYRRKYQCYNTDQDKVGKNFGSILINPLRPIERILNKSNESSDRHAREQIELLINSHKDVSVA